MAERLPSVSVQRNLSSPFSSSTSMVGRGLEAIRNVSANVPLGNLEERYCLARGSYNRITDDGNEIRFNCDATAKVIHGNESESLRPFFSMRQQLKQDFSTFQELADQGYGKAYFPLARMYLGGQGISRKADKAEYYMRMAFNWCTTHQALADPEIWMDLAEMYGNGFGIEQNPVQSLSWCRKAAEAGLAAAQYNLGLKIEYGLGVKQDAIQAVFWYRKAADQGYAGAQCNLGLNYECGYGVEQDTVQAAFWYRRAAEQGYVYAQIELGALYEFGVGVARDGEQAAFWYRKAAEQGHPYAQDFLGELYWAGLGVAQDYEKAVFWYRQAAEQGAPRAQDMLHRVYPNGPAVETVDQQALYWYRKIAGRGHVKTQEFLSRFGINWKNR